MHFFMDTDIFKNLVKTVAPALDKKNSLGVAKQIHISACDKGVIMSATNMECTIKSVRHDNMEVRQDGAACVDGTLLLSLVSTLDEDTVSVAMTENRVEIKCGRSKFGLPKFKEDAFPPLHKYSEFDYHPIEKLKLFDAFDRVKFACSTDETRYHLSGIYVHDGDMVAVDGHRMAVYEVDLPLQDGILIPSASIPPVEKAFSLSANAMDRFGVCSDGTDIHFYSEDTAASIRLLSGKFPDYTKLVPASTSDHNNVVFTKDAMISAIKKVMLVLSDRTYGIRLTKHETGIRVYSETSIIGQAEAFIPCNSMPDITIGYNGKYILDILNHLKEDSASFYIRDTITPTLVEEKGYRHVVMPQKI